MHVLPALSWFAQDCEVAGLYIFWGVLVTADLLLGYLKAPVCGVRSYRRGKPNSGDIDFTILAPLSYKETCKPLLNRILLRLREIVCCESPSHSCSLVSFTLRCVRARTACVRVHACALPFAKFAAVCMHRHCAHQAHVYCIAL